MPLYEYRCLNCGKLIEKIQKFSDPPLTSCDKCGGALERLLSPPAIQFKGSGWYITDYARKSESGKREKPAAGKAKKDAEPTKPSSSDSKSSSDKKG